MTAVLVLGGTTEAVALSRDLAMDIAFDVVYSLAGRTRAPTLPGCALRRGGFGGVEGLVRYIAENKIAGIVDATHPYAVQMSDNAREAANQIDVPLFTYLRPAWEEPSDAPWIRAASARDAARIVDGRFGRVFLSSGLGDIAAFSEQNATWFLVRSIDPPDGPVGLAAYHYVTGRGPFDVESEVALLREWRIDALVSKNSGGAATAAKLAAARALDIPVIMIDRPPAPPGTYYNDVTRLVAAVRQSFR